MGNQLNWKTPPIDANWEKTEIYRSDSETGTYTLIYTQDLPDNSYYDCNGTSVHWYKIKFTSTIDCTETELSEAFQGNIKTLYADPAGVLKVAGLTEQTLPESITINTLFDWIYDVSRNIDNLNETVYGRTESFNYISSSKNLNTGRRLIIPYKNIQTMTVEFRTSITDSTYTTLREYYDYEHQDNMIKLYRYPLVAMRTMNDIKVSGIYGKDEIPDEIRQLTEMMTAIKIFVHITGGTYNDVTSYSLGSYNESLGEPYVNLRETIKIIDQEMKRLVERTGIKKKKEFNEVKLKWLLEA